jgi:hypothetical protein
MTVATAGVGPGDVRGDHNSHHPHPHPTKQPSYAPAATPSGGVSLPPAFTCLPAGAPPVGVTRSRVLLRRCGWEDIGAHPRKWTTISRSPPPVERSKNGETTPKVNARRLTGMRPCVSTRSGTPWRTWDYPRASLLSASAMT